LLDRQYLAKISSREDTFRSDSHRLRWLLLLPHLQLADLGVQRRTHSPL